VVEKERTVSEMAGEVVEEGVVVGVVDGGVVAAGGVVVAGVVEGVVVVVVVVVVLVVVVDVVVVGVVPCRLLIVSATSLLERDASKLVVAVFLRLSSVRLVSYKLITLFSNVISTAGRVLFVFESLIDPC
jgi:hypothetical protein